MADNYYAAGSRPRVTIPRPSCEVVDAICWTGKPIPILGASHAPVYRGFADVIRNQDVVKGGRVTVHMLMIREAVFVMLPAHASAPGMR